VARERIVRYADEYGANGSRPGAIVDFVRRLQQLVERGGPESRAEALEGAFDKVLTIADKLGLEHHFKWYVGDLEVEADDHDDVGFFQDGNEVLWRVFLEDGCVRYELFGPSAVTQ
jgi:hypothetical protein